MPKPLGVEFESRLWRNWRDETGEFSGDDPRLEAGWNAPKRADCPAGFAGAVPGKFAGNQDTKPIKVYRSGANRALRPKRGSGSHPDADGCRAEIRG
jgi:hypothetical protein